MKTFGLLGKKLSYSLSPIIHQAIFDRVKVEGEYDLIEIEPDKLTREAFLKIMDKYEGINVTIPYKTHVMPFLDAIHPAAAEIGAINTVVKRDGKLIGYNTDYFGALETIKGLPYDKAEGAIVLGTGGSSKALVQCLRALDIKPIYQVSRTPDTVDKKDFITYLDYATLSDTMPMHCLLVNCTPVGMKTIEDRMKVHPAFVRKQACVFDLIYNPEMTPMLSCAASAGVPYENGLKMLIIQAIEAEKLWLNKSDIEYEAIAACLMPQLVF